MSRQIASDTFDEFAVALSATVHGDMEILTELIMASQVALSQILLASLVANVSLMAIEACDQDLTVAEYLPEFLMMLRENVVAQ